MKKTNFTLLFLFVLYFFGLDKASGQWATSGNNINNTNTGNVGIGNSAPASLLYVGKNMGEPTITIRNLGGGGGATYSMIDDASGADWKFKATALGGFKIRDNAAGIDVFTIESNSAVHSIYIKNGGKIGMGTTNPNAKLHIYNNDKGLIVDGASLINTVAFQGLGMQYFFGSGEGSIQASYPGGFGLLTFHTTNYGTMVERMRINYDGRVGIGTDSPGARLQVNSPAGSNETSAIIDNLEPYDGSNGLYVNTASTSVYSSILNVSSGYTSKLFVRSDGNIGIGTTSPSAKLQIQHNSYSYSQFGANVANPNFIYHGESAADGDGQSALFGYRSRINQNDGFDYSAGGTNNAIKGYNLWGDLYTFSLAGHNYNDYIRCGGVLGADISGWYWGSLGYKNSGGTGYGGYFNSTLTGPGKSFSTAMTGIGMGAWGDLMGADIHGKVYGSYIEGQNYAVYAKGNVYNDKLDIHLQENGTEVRTVLYTNTSTDVTVQTSGKAVLSGGRAVIDFDPAFAASLSSEESLVITVTPVGESNGVYLSQVTKSGFTVVENNAGRSNVTVNYIAVGKRAGYENPILAKEVISADYDSKIARGLHADADLQTNGDGLYYENGKLLVGIHPSTLPDPNKPIEERLIKADVDAPVPTAASIDPATEPNRGLMKSR